MTLDNLALGQTAIQALWSGHSDVKWHCTVQRGEGGLQKHCGVKNKEQTDGWWVPQEVNTLCATVSKCDKQHLKQKNGDKRVAETLVSQEDRGKGEKGGRGDKWEKQGQIREAETPPQHHIHPFTAEWMVQFMDSQDVTLYVMQQVHIVVSSGEYKRFTVTLNNPGSRLNTFQLTRQWQTSVNILPIPPPAEMKAHPPGSLKPFLFSQMTSNVFWNCYFST